MLGALTRFGRTLVVPFMVVIVTNACLAVEKEDLRFHISDTQGNLVACRIHLYDSSGTPQTDVPFPSWKDHFVCPGIASIKLRSDKYSWEIERGPEYRRLSGTVDIQAGQVIEIKETLPELEKMCDEGWYSADLHVHRPASDIKLLMAAEDLDFAPVIDWWNKPSPSAVSLEKTEYRIGDGRVYCVGAGEDEREGGALLYFGLMKPLDLTVKSREFPSPMLFVRQAKQQDENVWIDIEKPFWWDVPTWLAVAEPDSIGIAHNHMQRRGVLGNEAWGRGRDIEHYPGVKGNGLWTQQIYYHILNSGIRIPPSAGSASGVLPNPVGYNRVYVQLGDAALTRKNWFNGLRMGRCFVTNGPLLRVKANGTWPGETIELEDGSDCQLEIQLASNDVVDELEVIYNGVIIDRITCSGKSKQSLSATIQLTDPGWFLVRAIADVDHTFRFASTAPWYVDGSDNQTRISRASTRFFLDWVDERIDRVNQNVPDLSERESILKWHIKAHEFWNERLRAANAD